MINTIEENISKPADNHEKRIERMYTMLRELYGNDQKHDERIERIIQKVLEHDDKYPWVRENMATKQDFHQILETLNFILKRQESMLQEMVMTNHALRQHEDKLEEHDRDIATLKTAIHV